MLVRPNRFEPSSRVPFVPRQVLLGSAMAVAAEEEERTVTMEKIKKEKKEKAKKKKKPSETLEPAAAEDEGRWHDALIRSVGAYLEKNGFLSASKAFWREALSEVSDDESPVVDLEDLFRKSYCPSNDPEKKVSVKGIKEQDLQKDDISREVEGKNMNSIPEQSHKKKRQKADGSKEKIADAKNFGLQSISLEGVSHEDLKETTTLSGNRDIKKLKSAEDTLVETKEKKRRKKSISDLLMEDAQNKQVEVSCWTSESTDLGNQLPDPKEDNKGKKTKRHKEISDSLNLKTGESENFKEMIKEGIEELKSLTKSSETKDKGEKKREKKAKDVQPQISEDAINKKPDLVEEEKSNGSKKECEMDKGVGKSNHLKKECHKNATAPEDNDVNIGKKTSKKRKRIASEETDIGNAGDEPKVNTEGGQNNKKTDLEKTDKPDSDIEHPAFAKKMKKEERSENNAEKEVEREAENGNFEDSWGGVVSSEARKKEKDLKKAKIPTPFQRVKVDEVKFADERLKDNSYWSKDGADSGYGAKAQEVLGQVRGRGFRHEKTKKKRGTYRGGQIDLQSHSIKFTNSDDE